MPFMTPQKKNVRYAMPNKFYESILNGIPILVANGTVLGKKSKGNRDRYQLRSIRPKLDGSHPHGSLQS